MGGEEHFRGFWKSLQSFVLLESQLSLRGLIIEKVVKRSFRVLGLYNLKSDTIDRVARHKVQKLELVDNIGEEIDEVFDVCGVRLKIWEDLGHHFEEVDLRTEVLQDQ